jgi:hypothetical protein
MIDRPAVLRAFQEVLCKGLLAPGFDYRAGKPPGAVILTMPPETREKLRHLKSDMIARIRLDGDYWWKPCPKSHLLLEK